MAIILYMDDDTERALPAKKEVCPSCQGHGQTSAYNIGAITADEWSDWHEDERADYLAGRYDEVCPECKGLRVIDVLDRERCSPDDLTAYEDQQQQFADDRACQLAEIAAGA